MKKIILVCALTISAPLIAAKDLTIINHYHQPLTFILGKNPEVLPNFAENFDLADGEITNSQVAEIGKHGYIRVEDKSGHSAFWGIDVVDHETKLHGYLSHGIAYSWKTGPLIFCTPEDYKVRGYCQ